MQLVIGNKNASSWSLRPWIAMRQFDIPFEEVRIALRKPDTAAQIARYSPSGKVPCLIDGAIKVWDSLAIIEYVAECQPKKAIWPRAKAARAYPLSRKESARGPVAGRFSFFSRVGSFAARKMANSSLENPASRSNEASVPFGRSRLWQGTTARRFEIACKR